MLQQDSSAQSIRVYFVKGPRDTSKKKEVTLYEKFIESQNYTGTDDQPSPGFRYRKNPVVSLMSRGPRPHRALAEAMPIAQVRGVVQMSGLGPERIFDISIVSKLPITFARVMFAPQILAAIVEIADDF
ncbi:MAG: hypothetical protein Q8N94_06780, partial [Methanoregula sp.]|nr:hypothetical protein [Methanoregula sp.]